MRRERETERQREKESRLDLYTEIQCIETYNIKNKIDTMCIIQSLKGPIFRRQGVVIKRPYEECQRICRYNCIPYKLHLYIRGFYNFVRGFVEAYIGWEGGL